MIVIVNKMLRNNEKSQFKGRNMLDAKPVEKSSNFKDCKRGLIILGVIRILLGGMGVFTLFLEIIKTFPEILSFTLRLSTMRKTI